MRAPSTPTSDVINQELDKATYFEHEALAHVQTHRQRALAMGLLHAVDMMRAVAAAEAEPLRRRS